MSLETFSKTTKITFSAIVIVIIVAITINSVLESFAEQKSQQLCIEKKGNWAYSYGRGYCTFLKEK